MQNQPEQGPSQNEQDLSLRSTIMVTSSDLISEALASIKTGQNSELASHTLKVTQVTSGRDLTLHTVEDEMIEEDFTLWLDEDEPETDPPNEPIQPIQNADQSLQAKRNEKGLTKSGEVISVSSESLSDRQDILDKSHDETTEPEFQESDKDDFSSIPDLSFKAEQVEKVVEPAPIIETPETEMLVANEGIPVFTEQSETATLTEAETQAEMPSESPSVPDFTISKTAELPTWLEILNGFQAEQKKIRNLRAMVADITRNLSEIQSQLKRKDS